MINLLPQKCNVSRNVITKDNLGTPIESFETILTGVKCRLSRDNRGKREQKEPQDTVKPDYILYVTHKTDIKAGDIIDIEGIQYTAGEPYKAYGAIMLHHKEVPVMVKQEV